MKIKNLRIYGLGEYQTIAFYITIDGKESAIYKECTDFEFFAWVKQNFIPVQDLVACWISNYYIK